MSDLNDQQLEHLSQDVNNGHIIRAFCQHPGFKLYKAALDAILEDKKNAWLKGTEEDARLERIRAQGVQRAVEVLKQFMVLGDNASRMINENAPEVTK
jgi:hypothetical protein